MPQNRNTVRLARARGHRKGATMLAEVRTFPRAKGLRCAFLLLLLILLPELLSAQNWVWSTEVVDTSGTSTSLAADAQGNMHISFWGNEGIKDRLRPSRG